MLPRGNGELMKHTTPMCAALLVLILAPVAQANVGTPLMWAGMLHLILGNLLIGVLEGILLAKFFKAPTSRAIGLLILANYFSAWVGASLVIGGVAGSIPIDLNNAWMVFWLAVAATYVATLVLEWPFVALIFRGDARWLRKSVCGSFVVQTVSYLLLFGWYWWASGTSLYTRTDVVELSAMSLPKDVVVHYIDAADGDVYSLPLGGEQARKIFDLNSSHWSDRLLMRPHPTVEGNWDLVARLNSERGDDPTFVTIQQSLAGDTIPRWRETNPGSPEYGRELHVAGPVPKLGDARGSAWAFDVGFWPIEGLTGSHAQTGDSVWLTFDTVVVAWTIRNATHLPGDKVLLQLGGDQICIYDPEERQIALVARARGPIAVIAEARSDELIDGDE